MKLGLAKFVIGVAIAAILSGMPALAGSDEDMIERGRYLVTIGNCTDCHTDGFLLGAPNEDLYLAGADNGIFIPELGVMYPPNLTPDMETGLGGWSAEDIVRALKQGVRPDGSVLRPPMPIINTSAFTDEDALAVATFLKSMAPVRHATQPNPVPPEDAKGPYMTFVFPEQ
jgi:mono/diheme cytochrome c family protein